MKLSKIILLVISIISLSSCASRYKMINPEQQNYNSNDTKNGISLEYKYDLLHNYYAKKEIKEGVKVVAIRITNNSENDIIFGKDIKLAYENDKELNIIDNGKIFTSLKQHSENYLLYLLLSPLGIPKVTLTENGLQPKTTPIGLIIGPGLAGGNMIAAESANSRFRKELLKFNLNGALIKKGETKYGLIGINSNTYDAIRIKLK